MKKTFVLVHDAGGAEIVAAYIGAHAHAGRFAVYAAGPALKILEREGVEAKKIDRADLKEVISSYRGGSALFGTSDSRSLEFAALKLAKEFGLRTAGYLDSWQRYRERFGYPARSWEKNLPDEIWAGDATAYILAKEIFPHSTIRSKPNRYFKNIRARVRKIRRHDDAVLFLSDAGKVSCTLLKTILDAFVVMPNAPRMIIRLHPRDDRKKFKSLLRSYRNIRATLSAEEDIAIDIAQAHVAIGGETTALAVAALCGVPTICLWPKRVPLPFKGMARSSSVRAAVASLKRMMRG